jgi:DNA primase
MLKELKDISTLLRSEWSDPIIKTPNGQVLTKKDVYGFYNNPAIRKKLVSYLQGSPTIVVQSFAPGNDILRRKDDKGKEIQVTKAYGTVFDPHALDFWSERRATEFHKVLGKTTNIYVVDIDPKEGVPFDETKDVTKQVADALSTLMEVKNANIYYSGNRGFHVVANLNKTIPTDKARENLKNILTYFEPMGYSIHQDSPIRLDLSTMKEKGSFRAPYSLNAATGLVSIPVNKSELQDFEKSYASITHFLNPNLTFVPQRV